MTASPAAKKNAMRFCRWRCSSRSLAILDETDSGLDIDALRIVAQGVNQLANKDNAVVMVTHYQRLLNYIVPDFVHVMERWPHHQIRRQGAGAGTGIARLRLGEAESRQLAGCGMSAATDRR